MVNKVMITVHFVDYLIIIISNLFTAFYPISELRGYEITSVCNIAILSVCNVVFGFVIHQLATKIIAISANTTDTVARSLINAAATSDLVYQ